MKYKKIILILFLLIFILFPTTTKASFVVDNNGTSVELADLPIDLYTEHLHYLIVYNNFGYHLYYYIGEDFGEFKYDGRSIYGTYNDGTIIGKEGMVLSDYSFSSNSWGSLKPWIDLSGSGTVCLKGNDNVYHEDGSIFFRFAPLGQVGEIMEKVVQEEETPLVLIQIMKILPMILVVVVSFLGLRKCLRILLMLLRQA